MSPDYVFYHNADDPPYLYRAVNRDEWVRAILGYTSWLGVFDNYAPIKAIVPFND